MIEKLEIENFRGIAHGEISGLAPLTILVGPNSSGKSSVLEALLLFASPNSPAALQAVATRRGWIGAATTKAMLPKGTAQLSSQTRILKIESPEISRLELSELGVVGARVTLQGRYEWSGFGNGPSASLVEVQRSDVDPAELDAAVSRADLKGERAALISLLRPLLPGIRDLRILNPGDRYTLHVDDDTGAPWPATVAGDGLKRLLLVAARIAADDSGLILIEEPETYLHVGALRQMAKLLWDATAHAKQVIATTHSLELIDAIFGEEGRDLPKSALLRLSLRRGELKAVPIPGDKVRELRAEIGEDLRR